MAKKFFASLAMLTMLSVAALAQDWDRAVSLYNQKQYRPAIKEFHAVLKVNAEAWKSWWYIGAAHYYLNEYEETIEPMESFIKASEKDEATQSTGLYYLGWAQFQMKQYDKATASLSRYIALAEKTKQKVDPSVRVAIGRAYIFLNRYADAIAPLTTAAAEMKTNASNYYFLGFAHHKTGRTDQAIAALNQAVALEPKNVDALTLLADIYFNQMKQNPAAAKQVISVGERLITVKDDQYTWALLGQAYLFEKQFAKAAPLLDKYARANPTVAGAWYQLGLAYSRSDQFKPAAEALEQAAKLAPTNLAALLEMGYVYESDKQYDKALSAYERAFEASGRKDETARAGIDRVKIVKGQQSKGGKL